MISLTWRTSGRYRRFVWTKMAVAWADTVGPELREALRQAAPRRTGQFADSISYRRFTALGSARVEWVSSSPIAEIILRGSRAHDIRPRYTRALHWADQDGDHFSRLVHHPGTRPNRFPERVWMERRADVQARLRQAIKEAMT